MTTEQYAYKQIEVCTLSVCTLLVITINTLNGIISDVMITNMPYF